MIVASASPSPMLAVPVTGTSTEVPTYSVPVGGESIETASWAPFERVALPVLALRALPAITATAPTAAASTSTPRRNARGRTRTHELEPPLGDCCAVM